jgi:hypothetical protein
MKKVKLLLLSVLCTVAAHAQLNGDGYYRIQNQSTQRYISPSDNYGYNEPGTTMVDVSALKTIPQEGVQADAGSVVYIKAEGDGYNLLGQGYQTKDVFPGHPYLKIWDNGDGSYKAYMTEGNVSVYLVEGNEQCMTSKNSTLDKADWLIVPMDEQNNYFGIAPNIEIGNEFYKSFFAAFPFTVASEGLKAYTITSIEENSGIVVIKEAEGQIDGATPVIFKSTAAEAENNKLTVGEGEPSLTEAEAYNEYMKQTELENGVHGAFFCNPVQGSHRNVIEYDPETMRVLGKDANGNLAFITANLEYIPANTAFIKVSKGTAETFLVVEEGSGQETIHGDVNRDGKIDLIDYNMVCQMVRGEIPATLEGDVNGDGEVNVTDIAAIIKLILNS